MSDASRVAASVRRKVPTVLQMEATECGAASLAMVLARYGRYEPLEVLREACGVSRDGARASNVVRAARRYGLAARGWRLEPDELWTRPLPMIVHWEFDHFLVLEGRSRRGVHLNDPARGRRVVTDAEFDEGFTGVALVLEPDETFVPGGEPYSLQAALRTRLSGSWPALAQTAVAGGLLLVPGLVVAGLSRVFVDRVLVHSDTSRLAMLVGAAALCAVMVVLLTILQRRALVRAQLKMNAVSTARFLRHLLNLPVRFYQQRLPGDLAQRALANNELASLVVGQFAATAISAVAVLAYVAMMAIYDPLLTAVAVATLVANVLVLRQVARRRSTGEQQLALAQGRLRGTTVDGLSSIETLKAAGGEADLFLRWTGQAARASGISVSLSPSAAVLQALPAIFTACSTAAVLYLGGRAVVAGTLSLGELVAFQVLMAGLLLPIQQLTALSRIAERLSATLRRLDDVLASPATVSSPADGRPLELRGEVELRDVTFGYARTAPPLLDGFNLHVRPGTRLALVGGSGSGKSTVARLLVGLEQPWTGIVVYDQNVPPDAVPAGAVGHVDQEVVLFEGDVWDNLTLWDRSTPEPAVVQATRDACVHDDISIRPGAYGAPVAEGGFNFSGGQRQRLEIARALVPDPSVLVLDEATSALDPLVEQQIDANLRRRGCTCIIVAHRLSTIRDADEIVLMERGRVIERGSHEELVAAGGAYLQLLQSEVTES